MYSLLSLYLIISVLVFEKGIFGFPLVPQILIIFTLTYFSPLVILEIVSKKIYKKKITNEKYGIQLFGYLSLTALISTSLYIFSILNFANNGPETGMIFLFSPVIFVVFLVIHFFWTDCMFWLEDKKGGNSRKVVLSVVLLLATITLAFGALSVFRCEGQGCRNIGYLIDTAIKQNNAHVCDLANQYQNGSSFLAPINRSEYRIQGSEDCYFELARDSHDTSICELAGKETSFCYSELSQQFNDPTLCEKISVKTEMDQFWKDHCFFK